MELKRLAIFVKLTFRRIMLISGFFDFVIADRAAREFNESNINFCSNMHLNKSGGGQALAPSPLVPTL
jgi:hypothetical protein